GHGVEGRRPVNRARARRFGSTTRRGDRRRAAKKPTTTWTVNWPALVEKLGVTLVTYEIERAGDAVRLTLTQAHDRPIDDDILSGGRQGWPAILSSLKSLLETGQALVIKMEPPQRMLEALKKLGIGRQ